MIAAVALLALAIVEPKDGALVPTLKEGQKAYFEGNRAERFMRMDNPADRARFLAMGSAQQPLKLEWTGPENGSWELTVAAEGGKEDFFQVTNRVVWITNLELGKTYHWMVKDAESGEFAAAGFKTEDIAPRLLRADGIDNFRDLGGWKTTDGRRVRENLFFRSAALRSSSKGQGGLFRRTAVLGERRITEAGIRTLHDDFGIKTDLELRSQQETAGMDDTVLGRDVRWVAVPFVAYELIDNVVRGREAFANIFSVLAKKESYPVLMHCSGGRDRTGTLAFLLNGLLGVPEEDLCRDWEASVFSDAGAKFSPARLQRLLDYLKTMPGDTLRERIEFYAKGCGVTDAEIASFRAIMLR